GFGNRVVIRASDGRSYSYGHASALLVHAGQTVQQGQRIALVGSTGNSTGPHLDFRIYASSGGITNPLAALPSTRVQLAGYRPSR
ncbi:MAG TPA: M23 family metallopeptidase, partial [Deinococcales bacterium]|nr:M23 family metallopeptidase [Deinococcales bacterium]